MLIVVLIVVALSAAVGGGTTYAWLSQTHAFQFIATHPITMAVGVAVSACLTLMNLSLRWLRWTFLLRRFHALVPTRETFRLFFGTEAIVTPFYLGELLRGFAISRRYRELARVVVWVWLVERCSDVAALLVLWGMAARSPSYFVPGLGVLIATPWYLAHLTSRTPKASRFHTGQITPLFVACICAGVSLAAWTLPVLALWNILRSLGSGRELSVAANVFASGTLIGGLTGTPGGLGATGSTMIIGLTEAGVAPETASAAALTLRFGTQWFAVALGVALVLFWRRDFIEALRTSGRVQQHFDTLANSYADNIPDHYRAQMLERKTHAMLSELPPPNPRIRGLDLGCGQGWYASELAGLGYTVHGVDLSQGQIEQAKRYCADKRQPVTLRTYDGVHLPYPDNYFDFAYSINVLHHVPSPDAQRDLMVDVLRVVKPGGRFFLHEMNVENALFRGYVSYLFPLLKDIDEGTELWIRPSRLPPVPGGTWSKSIRYFTFVPEFLPAALLRWMRPLERRIEQSPWQKYSAHYMATLIRATSREALSD